MDEMEAYCRMDVEVEARMRALFKRRDRNLAFIRFLKWMVVVWGGATGVSVILLNPVWAVLSVIMSVYTILLLGRRQRTYWGL